MLKRYRWGGFCFVSGGSRGYGVRARGYGFRARGYGVGARGYGSLVILVSAPVPLGLVWVLNWVGVGPRGLGDRA